MRFSVAGLTLAALTAAAVVGAPASAVTLTNGSGDGSVNVNTNFFGAFNGGVYNPVGPTAAASTVYASNVRFRVGNTGHRGLMSGTLLSSVADATSATSVFEAGSLRFTLVQTLVDLVENGVRTGSQLRQEYSITNLSSIAQTVEMVRYLDGDLQFDGSRSDGGGRLNSNGTNVLFETDSSTGANDFSRFLGIYNEGGVATGYDIDGYSALDQRITNGETLRDLITNDLNGDGFVDAGRPYDLALALGNRLSLGANGTATFATTTLFGSGVPGSVVVPGAVPEPATWATMMLGFGIAGGVVRRRRRAVAVTA